MKIESNTVDMHVEVEVRHPHLHPTILAINEALLSTLAACGDVNRQAIACPAPAADRAQAQVEEIAHRIAMRLAPRSHAYHEIWVDGEQLDTVALEQET